MKYYLIRVSHSEFGVWVKGWPVDFCSSDYPGLFVHRSSILNDLPHYSWAISEERTGLRIHSARTRKEATQTLLSALNRYGITPERFSDRVKVKLAEQLENRKMTCGE